LFHSDFSKKYYTTFTPKRYPTKFVRNMAAAPQKTTRRTAFVALAPPVFAETVPKIINETIAAQ
jgi:hypothetical protein